MAASPQVVTSNPLYLNARTLVYTAQELRKPWGDTVGVGVMDYDSFRVRQRSAGANMSIDAMTASVLNRAWVRGSTVTDQGMYRIDYNSATVVNVDIAAADATNPRIDQVYLAVEDQQHTGSNNQATIRVVTGTATGGATLDNRTGVGAAPAGMGSILLADVLVAATDTSITNAEIRDRRPFGVLGAGPSTFTALDAVQFQPAPGLQGSTAAQMQSTTSWDAQQACGLVYLPRRIVSATRIRWRYTQGGTANTANFNIGIYDASGRQIVATGATAYTGTLNQIQNVSVAISATTFEPGYYWIALGNAAGTASASIAGTGMTAGGSFASVAVGPTPNLYGYAASGGTTLPTTISGGFTDINTATGTQALRGGVPLVALTVG